MTARYEEKTIRRKVGVYEIEGRIAWNPERFNGVAVLFVLPWTSEEENIYHWVARISRDLAANGCLVLRYHPTGFGDSCLLRPEDNAAVAALQTLGGMYSYLQSIEGLSAISIVAIRSGAWLAERLPVSSDTRRLYIEPLLTAEDIVREEQRRGALGGVPHADTNFDGILDIQSVGNVEVISCGLPAKPSFNVRRAMKQLSGRITDVHSVVCPPLWENMNPPDCVELSQLVRLLLTADAIRSAPLFAPEWNRGDTDVLSGRKPVRISFRRNMLAGTCYPAADSATGAIVLCSGYRTGKNGPTGLLRFLSENFSAMGYSCLLYDYPGRGDSEGATELRMEEMADSAAAAAGWLRAETGLPSVTALGICAGAEAALRASVLDPAVDRLILLSASFPGGITPLEVCRKGVFERLRVQLRRFEPRRTFVRLFKGELNLAEIRRILTGKTPAVCYLQTAPETPPDFASVHANKVLLVAARQNIEDMAARDFYHKRLKASTTVQDIESSDHNFTAPQEREALMAGLRRYLQEVK